MDVQADVGHVVKMFAGDEPDDFANFALGKIFCQLRECFRTDFFLPGQFSGVIQRGPFLSENNELVLYSSSASNLAWFIPA